MLPRLSYHWLLSPSFLFFSLCMFVHLILSVRFYFLSLVSLIHSRGLPSLLPFLPPAAPGLSMVMCRHLYKSPRRGCRFLWPRPFGSLSLCLLEVVLARVEEQDSVSSCGEWPPRGFPRGGPFRWVAPGH